MKATKNREHLVTALQEIEEVAKKQAFSLYSLEKIQQIAERALARYWVENQ